MWSSHKVRPTRAEPADSFLKSAPQSFSATLQLIDASNKEPNRACNIIVKDGDKEIHSVSAVYNFDNNKSISQLRALEKDL